MTAYTSGIISLMIQYPYIRLILLNFIIFTILGSDRLVLDPDNLGPIWAWDGKHYNI